MKYLWDTNIAIYYLQQQFSSEAEKFIDDLLRDHQPAFSVISEIELLSWKTDIEKDMQILQNFLDDSHIFDLSQQIKYKTVEYRKTIGIKLPDAVIAATAFVNELTLLTRNTRDFSKCSINLINPLEL